MDRRRQGLDELAGCWPPVGGTRRHGGRRRVHAKEERSSSTTDRPTAHGGDQPVPLRWRAVP